MLKEAALSAVMKDLKKQIAMNNISYWRNFTTDQLLIAMPENHILYKDSGTWQIWDEGMKQPAIEDYDEDLRTLLINFLASFPWHEGNDITHHRMLLNL
jgi:hypothetical protein